MHTKRLVFRKLLLIFVLLPVSSTAQTVSTPTGRVQHNLMPVPSSVEFHSGRLPIKDSFRVATKGHSDKRLLSARDREVKRLQGRTGFTFNQALATDTNTATLMIQCEHPGQTVPSLSEDESYRIEVTERQAQLIAPTVVGVLRGLETLLQLVTSDRDGYFLPAVRIND